MKKRPTRNPVKHAATSSRKHLSAHIQAAATIRRRPVPATADKKKVSATRIVRLAIRVGNIGSIGAQGLSGLARVGSVTLFRWPGDVIAAGYTSSARPRHFVRMESGDFPKRLLRAYEKLQGRGTPKTVVSLVEIRALHAHLAWARVDRHGARDVIISLLPSALRLKPGKQYARAEIEEKIAGVVEPSDQ